MGWQSRPIPARKITFADGTVLDACDCTGFIMKDGTSREAKSFNPGDEFKNGKVVEKVVDEGKTINSWFNQE